jgi:hypothetical protein
MRSRVHRTRRMLSTKRNSREMVYAKRSDSARTQPVAMDRSRSPPRVRSCIPPVSEWTFTKATPEARSMVIRHDGNVITMTLDVVSP